MSGNSFGDGMRDVDTDYPLPDPEGDVKADIERAKEAQDAKPEYALRAIKNKRTELQTRLKSAVRRRAKLDDKIVWLQEELVRLRKEEER